MRRFTVAVSALWLLFALVGIFSTPLYDGWPQEDPPVQRRWRRYVLDTHSRVDRLQSAEKDFRFALEEYRKGIVPPVLAQREIRRALKTVRRIRQDLDYVQVAEEFEVFHGRFTDAATSLVRAMEQTVMFFQALDKGYLKTADEVYREYRIKIQDALTLYYDLVSDEGQVTKL